MIPPLRALLLTCFGITILSACGTETSRPYLTLTPVEFSSIPGWEKDDHTQALPALQRSCEALTQKEETAQIGEGITSRPAYAWKQRCAALRAEYLTDKTAARQYLEQNFQPLRAGNDNDNSGLFTGYYEPILKGARKRSEIYRYPVYRMPKHKRNYSRKAIDNGALKGKRLEIAWVEDPFALFFMHIQGSGRIQFENGEEIRLNYAGQNGKDYVSIGKVLIDRGEMVKEEVNMASIRSWLETHSETEAWNLLWENPSYVYFRENSGDGPVGAQGVVLTPERSMAVDTAFVPLGAPIFLRTTLPGGLPYERLMVAQDKGGAIKGPVRGDVFFGAGKSAELRAGYMKQRGEWYILLPREPAKLASNIPAEPVSNDPQAPTIIE